MAEEQPFHGKEGQVGAAGQLQQGGSLPGVDGGEEALSVQGADEGGGLPWGGEPGKGPPAEGEQLFPGFAQSGEPGQKVAVLFAPGEGAAVEGSSKPSIPTSSP